MSLCAIVLARCECGVTFPALPEVDRTGRCLGCRQHRDRSLNRIDPTSPGYRLAAEVSTYRAALQLVGIVGERALVNETSSRRELVTALQEIVEAAGAAVFGVTRIDPPRALTALVPRQRRAAAISTRQATSVPAMETR